jgi:hypothetical protein
MATKKKAKSKSKKGAAAEAAAAAEPAVDDEGNPIEVPEVIEEDPQTVANKAVSAAAGAQLLEDREVKHAKLKRLQELTKLLDLNDPTCDDLWAAIESRRQEPQALRGPYYHPPFHVVQKGKDLFIKNPDGSKATPLIDARASDGDLDEHEAEHVATLQAEFDELKEELGL